ncbi:MAG: hypothetical protein ACR2J3_06315 [Aridibacter sp.]
MKKNKILLHFCLTMLIALIGIGELSAQTDAEQKPKPAYMIYTYTIVGSNQTGANAKLPSEISGVVNELKGNYSYSNYRMLATHFQWLGSGGDVNYYALLKNFSSFQNGEHLIRANWSYNSFREDSDSGGKGFVGFRNFNFKLDFPINVPPAVQYSAVSIILSNIRVPADKPTVFASLPVDLTNETIFFVIKVKEVE